MIDARRHSSAIFRVVGAYAAFAALWILLSDHVLGLLLRDPERLVQASMYKGWFFVAVTSLLLYSLVRRFAQALDGADRRERALEHERLQTPPMLAAIAEASEDAIFAKDNNGCYQLFNAAAARIVGLPVERVLGRDDRSIFPREQAEHLMSIDRRIRESGVATIGEETLQTALGERVFLASKGPLRGADGSIFGIYGISRDITASIHEQRALRQLAEDLQTTLQAIPDLLFEIDAEGRYLSARASNTALLAAPEGDIIGRTLHEVLPRQAAETVMAALAAAGRTGSDYGRTIALDLGKDQRHFELSVACKPAVSGQPDRFLVLSRDVTARVVAEAELRRRYDELEHFNRVAVDRELRMVALKQEVNALARAAGQPPPYDTSFAKPPAAA
jgi:PAS domain S-box-containing protein